MRYRYNYRVKNETKLNTMENEDDMSVIFLTSNFGISARAVK